MDLLVLEGASEWLFMLVYIVKLTINTDLEMVMRVAISFAYTLESISNKMFVFQFKLISSGYLRCDELNSLCGIFVQVVAWRSVSQLKFNSEILQVLSLLTW